MSGTAGIAKAREKHARRKECISKRREREGENRQQRESMGERDTAHDRVYDTSQKRARHISIVE